MGVRGKRDLPCRINGRSCNQGSGSIYPSKWDCSPGQWGSAASFSPGVGLSITLDWGTWEMGRTAWGGCSWNSCLAQFRCKSLIPQECPGFALGTSCPAQGPGAAGGAAGTELDRGCGCPRVGCAQSIPVPWDEQGAACTALTAHLPLPISSALSAGFLWGFFLYFTFQTPSGLEMISSDSGVSHNLPCLCTGRWSCPESHSHMAGDPQEPRGDRAWRVTSRNALFPSSHRAPDLAGTGGVRRRV